MRDSREFLDRAGQRGNRRASGCGGYDDMGRSTLGPTSRNRGRWKSRIWCGSGWRISRPLNIQTPALLRLGLMEGRDAFAGKDTTTGHWEMGECGWSRRFPFTRTVSEGIDRGVREAIGRKTIGNKPASGREIIKELGEDTYGRASRCVHVRRQRVSDRRA